MAQIFSVPDENNGPLTFPLSEKMDRVELRFTLHNDASLIHPLATFLKDRVAAFGLCQTTLEKHVEIALEEALLNALYHGNLELSRDELQRAGDEMLAQGRAPSIVRRQRAQPYRDRRIHVAVNLSHNHAEFVIRDEGPGFDYAVCTPLVIDDGELARPHGRGLMLMYAYMDEVRFNEVGNEVTMRVNPAA